MAIHGVMVSSDEHDKQADNITIVAWIQKNAVTSSINERCQTCSKEQTYPDSDRAYSILVSTVTF